MRFLRITAPIAVVVVTLSGCTKEDPDEVASRRFDAAAEAVADLPMVREVQRGGVSDDLGDALVGQTDTYVESVLFVDRRRKCPWPRIDCGAVLELWSSAELAKARSEYIRAWLNSGPELRLGKERHFLDDRLLLRVTGKLDRYAAAEYADALDG